MMNLMVTRSLAASILLLSVVSAPALAVTPQPDTTAAPGILVAGKVMIDAPESVDPGASVSVMISGSSTDGRIELWGPVTQSGKGSQIDSVVTAGGSASLMAPTEPGSYELRYFNAANAMLARTTLEIAAAPITLSAPRGLIAGIDTEIQWRGPASPGDMIQVYDPASGAVLSEIPAAGHPGAANVAILRGPEKLGPYEVRYWSGPRQTVLRSLPVTVQAGNDWLRTPIEVFVGEAFPVDWQGLTDAGNLYQIVDPETGEVVTSFTGSGTGSVKLIAPKKPGAYRVQLVNPATGFVLADLPLDVDPK